MAKRDRSGGTAALVLLQREGVAFTEHAYDHDPRATSYGLEAAQALGVEPARVLKTLLASLDGRLVVGVVPVDASLDLKALARALDGRKAVMADPAEAERSTGYVVGGISPLGQRRALPTVVDEGAAAHASVLVSGGRRGLDVELSPADLLRLTQGRYAAIARR